MAVWHYAIISVIIVSLVSLIGIFSLLFSQKKLNKFLLSFVSLSTGTLFGSAFIHLIPEAAEKIPNTLVFSLWIIAGILFFFVLEKLIHWRHCHIPTSPNHPHPVGMMNLIGEGFHNLIDGFVIAASYMVSVQAGIATTIAVLIHEIPQEIGDFGVLIHAGYSRKKALFFNYISASAAILGAILMLAMGSFAADLSIYLLPFTAGGFIYIAGSDLIPELNKESYPISKVFTQLLWVVIGIASMVALLFLNIKV